VPAAVLPTAALPATILRAHLAALSRDGHGGVAFGDAAVDAHLPPGGLAVGALHEVGAAGIEAETGTLAAAFIACLLARLLARPGEARPVAWIARATDLHPPGLLAYGLDPARLLLVRGGDDAAILGAAEVALRAGGAAAVVAEAGALSRLAARRLHLACGGRGSTGFVLRRWPHGRRGAADGDGNAAATRWHLAPAPSLPAPGREPGPPRWQVTLTQARGGRPGAWLMQWGEEDADAPHALRVVAGLADAAGGAARRRQG
jgi:protein ImuA